MALLKCKECGAEVSKKAKACPKCGAPQGPKQYSLGKLLVLIVFAIFIYSLFSGNSSQVSSESSKPKTPLASSSSQNSATSEKVSSPEPSWVTSTSKDEMTGKFSAYAHSPVVYPSKKMGFPYHDVNSWMGVGCDAKSEWVYFGFNGAPNLANDETKDGYNIIRTRIKWGDNVANVSLTQNWGAKFIHFRDNSTAISQIAASSTALLELQWHGQQPAYFQYSLNGSSKAISEIKAKCAANK